MSFDHLRGYGRIMWRLRGIAEPHQAVAAVAPHLFVLDAGGAQRLGPTALGEFEIIGVIDDSAGVGILVIDAYRPAMKVGAHASSSPASSRSSCPAAGRIASTPT